MLGKKPYKITKKEISEKAFEWLNPDHTRDFLNSGYLAPGLTRAAH